MQSGGIGAIKGGFPEVYEFGKDIGRDGVRRTVIHEGNETGILGDEGAESGPGG